MRNVETAWKHAERRCRRTGNTTLVYSCDTSDGGREYGVCTTAYLGTDEFQAWHGRVHLEFFKAKNGEVCCIPQ